VNRILARDAGVVDEQAQLLACAHLADRFDAGIGSEVGDQRTNPDAREPGDDLLEPIAATAHDHESVGRKASDN